MTKLLQQLWKDEEGPTAVEYAFMLFLILLAISVATPGIGTRVVAIFQSVATALGAAPAA